MTQKINFRTRPVNGGLLIRQMVIGALIALILIGVFLYQVNDPKPEWGKFWMVRPLIIVPLAGAVGGAFYYMMNSKIYSHSWKKALAVILSVVVYIIGLWLGSVLGLDGTLWD